MEEFSTIALAVATFFGLSEFMTFFTEWAATEDPVASALTAVATEYGVASAFVASSTEAIMAIASSTELLEQTTE